MKKRSIIAILLTMVMAMSLIGTACSKAPKTIEEYISSDKEAMEEVQQAAEQSGLAVDFSGNDVIYSFDLGTVDGATEDIIKSDVMKEQLESALDSTGDTFVGLCKQLEEESKIEGIQIIINYTFQDEVIVTKTFNSSGAVGE